MRRTVLFVCHTGELYGAEKALLRLITGLDAGKYRRVLVIPEDGPLEEAARAENITVEKVPMKWWLTEREKMWKQPLNWLWNIPSVFRLASLAGRHGADLVFSNSAVSAAGALAAKIRRIPHVWYIHEILAGEEKILCFLPGSKLFSRFIQRFSCAVIVNAEAAARLFRGEKHIHLIHNGVETDPAPPGSRERLRKAFSFEKNHTVVGTVGKIYPGKGQAALLRAFILLHSKFSGLKLVFVGEARQPVYERRLRHMAAENGVEDAVFFTGFRRDIPELMEMMDIVVSASSVESFGVTILEAMAAGKPVLAVRAGGVSEIISHRENGFLTESNTPQDLARGLAGILNHPAEAEKAALRGKRDVERRFSVSSQVQKIEKVLNGCFA